MKHLVQFSLMIILFSCNLKSYKNDVEVDLIGKWQSLNSSNIVIEFTNENEYKQYIDSNPLTNLENFGKLKYYLSPNSNEWMEFKIIGENINQEFVKGRIEIVNKDRIRIYYHKHHYILDTADEYSRTNDLKSFDSIMDEIKSQND